MNDITDLQEALDKFPIPNDHLEIYKTMSKEEAKDSYTMSPEVGQWFLQFKELFSAFKVEYDGQLHVPRLSVCMSSEDYDRMVHIPRKQLEDLLERSPCYEDLDDIGGMENFGVQMWGTKVEKWVAELKELLGDTQK
jgi:hypothetical protein